MEIYYTSKFGRKYKKLPSKIKILAEKREELFCKNPFDSQLNTHKLHGSLKEFWSFSIGFKHGIVFEFARENKVYFHSVGDHDIYQ